MRGEDLQNQTLFSYVRPDSRIPANHPLRVIRRVTDAALASLHSKFAAAYAMEGRPSIPPERRKRRRSLTFLLTLSRISVGRTVLRRPIPWQQRFQCVTLGSTRDDTFQHIGQPGQRLDVIQFRGLDQ